MNPYLTEYAYVSISAYKLCVRNILFSGHTVTIFSPKASIFALETFYFSLLKPFDFIPDYFKWMSVAKFQKKQDAPPGSAIAFLNQ